MTHLCLYDIALEHPRDWSIYINPQKDLSFTTGAFKLQKVDKDSIDISLSMKWFSIEGFDVERYLNALSEGLKKKFKRKLHDFYVQKIEQCSHAAHVVQFSYADNHSIYRVLRKDEEVAERQILLPCTDTGRVVIAGVASLAAGMERHAVQFEQMLGGLTCHAHAVHNDRHASARHEV